MIMRFIKKFFAITLLIVICGFIYLSSTSGGLRLTLDIAKNFIPGKLTVDKLHGSLLHGASAERVIYEDPSAIITLSHVQIAWRSFPLLKGKLAISQASAHSLQVALVKNNEPSSGEVFSIPAEIEAETILLDQFILLTDSNAAPIQFAKLHASIHPEDTQAPLQLRSGKISIPTGKENSIQFPASTLLMKAAQNSWQFTLTLEHDDPLLNKHTTHIEGTLYPQWLEIKTAHDNMLDGNTTAKGFLKWEKDFIWQLKVNAEKLKLQHPASPLNGLLDVSTKFGGHNEQFILQHLDAKLGQDTFHAEGMLDKTLQFTYHATIPDLSRLQANLHGRAKLSGSIQGEPSKPDFVIQAQGAHLKYHESRIQTVDAQIKSDLSQFTTQIKAQNIQISNNAFDSLTIQTTGTRANNHTMVQLSAAGNRSTLNLNGTLDEKAWTGKLSSLHLNVGQLGEWQSQQPSDLVLSPKNIQLAKTCLHSGKAQFCVNTLSHTPKALLTNVTIHDFPLKKISQSLCHDCYIDSHLEANLNAQLLPTLSLESSVQLSPGAIHYQVAGIHKSLPLQDGKISIRNHQHDFTGQGAFHFDNKQNLSFNLSLPQFDKAHFKFEPKQKILSHIKANIRQLDLLPVMIPSLNKVNGHIKGDVHISGTLGKPEFDGYAKASLDKIKVPDTGVTLNQIKINAHAKQKNDIEFTATAIAGGKTLSAVGRTDTRSANLTISGQDLLIWHDNEYEIYASPQLFVKAEPHLIAVTGNVSIPSASLKPMSFNQDAVSLPDDVHIVKYQQQEDSTSAIGTSLNLNLTLGDNIVLNANGLKGKVGGELKIHKNPNQATTASGQLHLLDGVYKAYGQHLKIRKGNILFLGGAIDDPTLEVEAVKHIANRDSDPTETIKANLNALQDLSQSRINLPSSNPNLRVGIRITGTVSAPRINLFSEPVALSQSDVLSYLVFGKPASATDAGTLLGAAASMNLSSSDTLSIDQQLQNGLGLDELSIEDNPDTKTTLGNDIVENSLENRSLVIGKKLSSRLYLNYTVGILKPISILKLRYSLGKNWTIQTESSSDAQGIDLFYTYER